MEAITTTHSNTEKEYSRKNYITYYKGDIASKIILLAVHGGNLKPDTIIDRDVRWLTEYPNESSDMICTENDDNTKELALLLRNQLNILKGISPHLIMCNLHRKKIDLNRDIFEATLKDYESMLVYKEFHSLINEAKQSVTNGIVLDLHGQSHPEGWVELGYCINIEDLRKNNLNIEQSSISSLAKRSKYNSEVIIHGEHSLGYFLQEENIKSVPSPNHKYPKSANYYSGGYNTKKHGSKLGGKIDAIQIESPIVYRNFANIQGYAKRLAKAIDKYVSKHYE